MKRILVLTAGLAFLLGGLVVASRAGGDIRFGADLSGADEVPAVDTIATGGVEFEVSGDGSMITFEFKVSKIVDVTQSHIHIAPAGSNGPIAVWLVPARPPLTLIRGEVELEVKKGSFAASDLVGPLAGKTLADLVAEFKAGNAYVNVHTAAHGPGEIRGQVMSR
ncbi:MAG: CHRD domain-containing protein [Chloroflexi bacterium]|nr:CHRD domain-containing protein [Chloroflexota bacterium]